MFKAILLLPILVGITRAYATPVPQLKLTPEIENMISDRLRGGLRKDDAAEMLRDVLGDIESTDGPLTLDPLTGQPYYDFKKTPAQKRPEVPFRPDELRGCVTKTRTICTGSGKDRECTTDSWEVCVSSD